MYSDSVKHILLSIYSDYFVSHQLFTARARCDPSVDIWYWSFHLQLRCVFLNFIRVINYSTLLQIACLLCLTLHFRLCVVVIWADEHMEMPADIFILIIFHINMHFLSYWGGRADQRQSKKLGVLVHIFSLKCSSFTAAVSHWRKKIAQTATKDITKIINAL